MGDRPRPRPCRGRRPGPAQDRPRLSAEAGLFRPVHRRPGAARPRGTLRRPGTPGRRVRDGMAGGGVLAIQTVIFLSRAAGEEDQDISQARFSSAFTAPSTWLALSSTILAFSRSDQPSFLGASSRGSASGVTARPSTALPPLAGLTEANWNSREKAVKPLRWPV